MPLANGQVNFGDISGFEQTAIAGQGSLTFGKEKNAGGFSVETVNEAQITEITGGCPEIARLNAPHDRGLEVASGFGPGRRNNQPINWFIDGQDRTVFEKDGDSERSRSVFEEDMVWFCHGFRVSGLEFGF